jgi:hypothetical protein
MYKEFYRENELLLFPLAALVLFIVMFLAAVVRTFLRHRHDATYESLSVLPLADDTSLAPAVPNGEKHV